MRFVVASLRIRQGGPIVAHTLCRELIAQGHDAKIFYSNIFNGPDTNMTLYWIKWLLSGCKNFLIKLYDKVMGIEEDNHFCWDIKAPNGKKLPRHWFPFVSKDTIVIYPDTFYGNLLNAENVVHWFLYYNRFPNDPNVVGVNDLVLSYREVFNDKTINPDCKLFFFRSFNLELYKRTNYGKRRGNCYVIRKGKTRLDLPEAFDGIIIDNLTEKEKVRVFNECEYCYCYDLQSAYARIASLCGCISVVVLEEGKTVEDYRTDDESRNGVAFGTSEEELNRAMFTQPKLVEEFEKSERDIRESTTRFVKLCREHFGITDAKA